MGELACKRFAAATSVRPSCSRCSAGSDCAEARPWSGFGFGFGLGLGLGLGSRPSPSPSPNLVRHQEGEQLLRLLRPPLQRLVRVRIRVRVRVRVRVRLS